MCAHGHSSRVLLYTRLSEPDTQAPLGSVWHTQLDWQSALLLVCAALRLLPQLYRWEERSLTPGKQASETQSCAERQAQW